MKPIRQRSRRTSSENSSMRSVRETALLVQLTRDERFAALVGSAVGAAPSWRADLAAAFEVGPKTIDRWADGSALVHHKIQRQVAAWIYQRATRASGARMKPVVR